MIRFTPINIVLGILLVAALGCIAWGAVKHLFLSEWKVCVIHAEDRIFDGATISRILATTDILSDENSAGYREKVRSALKRFPGQSYFIYRDDAGNEEIIISATGAISKNGEVILNDKKATDQFFNSIIDSYLIFVSTDTLAYKQYLLKGKMPDGGYAGGTRFMAFIINHQPVISIVVKVSDLFAYKDKINDYKVISNAVRTLSEVAPINGIGQPGTIP